MNAIPATSGGGGAADPITDTGSYSSPASITATITVPTDLRARIFVQGNGGPVAVTTIGDGAAGQELHVVGTSDVNTVEIASGTPKFVVNGSLVFKAGTTALFHWIVGLAKWVEVSRNEI